MAYSSQRLIFYTLFLQHDILSFEILPFDIEIHLSSVIFLEPAMLYRLSSVIDKYHVAYCKLILIFS